MINYPVGYEEVLPCQGRCDNHTGSSYQYRQIECTRFRKGIIESLKYLVADRNIPCN